MATTTTRSAHAGARQEKPAKRKREQRTEIWSNLLRQTREAQARSRTHAVQSRELLLCGGSSDDQRAFVQTLARSPPTAPPSRNRDQRPQNPKGEVRLSNQYAYGYGHVTLYSPPQQTAGMLGADAEEAARLEVHTLPEPETVYEQTLRRLLDVKKHDKEEGAEVEDALTDAENQEEARRPAVAILLSWKEPWRFLDLLRRWLHLLARSLLPPESPQEDPLEVLKEHRLSLAVIVQHVEAQEGLEREGYREESFDYISQCLRTCILPLSAALVHTSSNPPPQLPGSPLSEVQKVLYTGLALDLSQLSPAPAKGTMPAKREDLAPKHNVVDRMAIVVPSGWDSVGKIRLLSETFSPEAVLEAWVADLNAPLQPPQQDAAPTEEPDAIPRVEQQANGGAEQHEQEVYATSDAGEDEELAARPDSPSKQQRSAIASYEEIVLNPNAHKAARPPQIEVTTKPDQKFLAEMRAHLQELEAQDAERAKNNSGMGSSATGTTNTGRMIGLPTGEQTGALNELGDVSFNVGGVSYNSVTAEAAIERLKRGHQSSSPSGPDSSTLSTPRNSTPRPPRREDRDSTPQPPPSVTSAKGTLEVEKLEEYFASLMKKGGGGSAASTPSKAH